MFSSVILKVVLIFNSLNIMCKVYMLFSLLGVTLISSNVERKQGEQANLMVTTNAYYHSSTPYRGG